MTVGKVYRHRPGEHLYCSGKRLWPHRIAAILAARMRAGCPRSRAELVIRRKAVERGHPGRMWPHGCGQDARVPQVRHPAQKGDAHPQSSHYLTK